ncbi:MAG: Ig-like domain-containing protein, partial [Promethearchaeota archaeon]
WYQDIDVTQFPDGFIDVEARIEDGAGNVGFTMWTFEVDNYNEFTLPPTIDLFPPTPANNSHLSGTVPITMNLTDDIDIFAATITIGEGPMLGSAYVFNETGTPGIYSFDYNTMIEAENSGKWITITAWDMDGHQTDYYLHYIIDNLAAGNPPNVTIISPNEGDILQDVVTFQVAANDDNGISSIQGQIDDRVPTDMNFNSGTGYYEFEYNVSTLINGTHTFSAIVIDVDDPSEGTGQHTVNQIISFFADTDITEAENTLGPEVRNVYPLNVTNADDILNGTINFNLEIKDDVGISAVNIKISSVSSYGVTNIPGSVDDVDMNNILIVGGYPQGMNLVGTSDGWSKYDNSFDSTKVSDGIYLVEITIGDLDTKQHTTDVKILILVLNSQSGNPFADIPGFSIEFFIGAMLASSAFIIWKLRKKFRKLT